ncbi:TetR/AcrR family transcriptional regulator [Myxococcota bacterium]|nr:TetR/AcrR family transcriptional regulator [Myxococcota bacterium]
MSVRQQGREQRLQRIVDAARGCFAEQGFAGTTVETIAARAAVSNGLLYKHFQGKEHLFQVVVTDIVRDWVRALVPAESEGLGPTEKLEAMFRRSVAFCRTNPLLPAVLSGDKRFELARRGSPDRGRVHAHRQLVASVLADGIAKGEFRADLEVDATADLIQHVHAEYASRAYRSDPEFPYDDALVDAAVRFIHAAVKA